MEQTIERAEDTEQRCQDFDPALADELSEVAYYSESGTVEVEVTRVDYEDGEAIVTFNPPAGEPFERRWEVPHHIDHRTGFTDMLSDAGRNLDTAEEIVGDRVRFKYEDGEWEPAFSVPTPPFTERVRNRLGEMNIDDFTEMVALTTFLVALPVLTTFVILASLFSNEVSFAEAVGGLTLLNMFWFLPASFIAMLLIDLGVVAL